MKDELMKEIGKMGQIDDEIWENAELYDIVSDVIYSDIQMMTKYNAREVTKVLDVPLLVMTGEGDPKISVQDMKEWDRYTDKKFEFEVVQGNHFFHLMMTKLSSFF